MVVRQELQGLQIAPHETSYGRERLGSSPEVDRFRVDVGHGSLVKRLATCKALHLGQRSVRTAVGGADANVGARVHAGLHQIMGAQAAGMDLYRDHLSFAVTEYLEIGQQARRDRVGDEV